MKNLLLFIFLLCATTFTLVGQNLAFEIKFKSENFTPEITTDFEEAIQAQKSEKNQAYNYRLIQFYDIPTTAGKQRIKKAGIELLSYIPNKAFISKIQRNISVSDLAGLNIRSIFTMEDRFKLSPQLTKNELPEWAMVGNDIKLNVQYYSKADKENLIESITNNNGKVIFQLEKINVLTVQYSAEGINELAKNPLIQSIEPISPPGTPEGTVAKNTMRSNNLNTSCNGGRKYDGTGIVVSISDDGVVGPHIDRKGRVTLRTTRNTGEHGDMTSGIFVGAGNLDPRQGGIARGADIHVFLHDPSTRDLSSHEHILNGVQNLEEHNIVVTSTSWSQGTGGIYNVSAQFGDQQLFENQNLIHVLSGGNTGDRDHDYGAGPGWANITGGYKAGKNVICVGNVSVNDVLDNSSARGPAADGRIKPDLCAQGDGTLTTDENNTYQIGGGTSAATPAVAGIVTQLYQAYKEHNGGVEPETGLLKAALLNTAKDLGNPGPDFQHGWGRVNALKAVRIIEDKRYIRDSIGQGESRSHSIAVPDNVSEVRVMTYWTDVEGNIVSGVGLVNDINMQLVTPAAVTHNPWVLDPTPNATNLDADAVEGIDHLNNVEQVTISNPIAGDYTINLSGFAIPEGPQVYYVLYDFIYNGVELTYPVGGEGFVPGETEIIRWDASEDSEDIKLEYSIDGGATYNLITDAISSDAIGYNWVVPEELSSNVMLKISRGAASSESDTTLTIAEVPQNLNIVSVCPDGIEIEWDPVDGVTMYEISLLGEHYMDSIAVSSTNTFEAVGLNPNEEHWFSVRSLVSEGKGRRAIAINQPGGTQNCMLSNDVALVQQLYPVQGELNDCIDLENTEVIVNVTNVGIQTTTDVELNYQINGGAIVTEVLSAIAPGESINYTFLTQADISTLGNYEIATWSSWAIDENNYNDTIFTMTEVINSDLISSFPYVQNFESFTNCSTAPTCELITCDLFEGWTNVRDPNFDDIDWRTDSEGTGTSNTGPTTDYNTGTPDGKYLYLEGTEGCNFREAVLLSPCIDLTLVDTAYLEFAYHMFGVNTGELHVDIITGTGEIIDVVSPIIGNQGDSWQLLTVDLTPYVGEIINIKIRGSIGNNSRSDTAIDAINIISPSSVGVENLQGLGDNIKIYPNPTSDYFNIEFPSNLSTQQVNIKVVNVLGKPVIELDNIGTAERLVLGHSEIVAGVYFVLISGEDFETVRKVIKK